MSGIQLSIIIPHYNSIGLLQSLIDSIPERREIEILVIDDCSTENAEDVHCLEKSRPWQLQLFYNEPGKNSAGACRNIGLEHAQGEWLLFADSDDYFMPGFYEGIREYLDSDYDIVYFPPTSVDLKTHESAGRHKLFAGLINEYVKRPDKENLLRLKYYWEGPCSKLIRRSLTEGGPIRFDCTKVANDAIFSVKTAYVAKKVGVSEEVIYCITKGDGSLTALKKKENFYTRLDVFIRKYKFLKEHLSGDEWKTLDLLGAHYIKMAKAYGLSRIETVKVYWIFLCNGVRPYISRKWNMRKVIAKLKGTDVRQKT